MRAEEFLRRVRGISSPAGNPFYPGIQRHVDPESPERHTGFARRLLQRVAFGRVGVNRVRDDGHAGGKRGFAILDNLAIGAHRRRIVIGFPW